MHGIGRRLLTAGALTAIAACLVGASPADAAPPPAGRLVERMKAALEPDRPSVRAITMNVTAQDGAATEWTAGEARKKRPDGSWMLLTMLAPAEVKGVALLVHERADGDDEQWVYVPAVRRVRKIVPVARYQAFLDSDFTYADLGFVSRRPAYQLRGSALRDGVSTYEVEEVPRQRWYYTRILTWIAADSGLPVRREFYDTAGALWKVERFEDVQSIAGIPTPLDVHMYDVQTKGSSDLRSHDVRYGVDIPDSTFTPDGLQEASSLPLWK